MSKNYIIALICLFLFGCGYFFGSLNAKVETREVINEVIQIETETIDWDILKQAIIYVESTGDSTKVGKANDVGIFQITPIYVAQANKIVGYEKYKLKDRYSVAKSHEMFDLVQGYYNPDKNAIKAIYYHNPRARLDYALKIINKYEDLKGWSL